MVYVDSNKMVITIDMLQLSINTTLKWVDNNKINIIQKIQIKNPQYNNNPKQKSITIPLTKIIAKQMLKTIERKRRIKFIKNYLPNTFKPFFSWTKRTPHTHDYFGFGIQICNLFSIEIDIFGYGFHTGFYRFDVMKNDCFKK